MFRSNTNPFGGNQSNISPFGGGQTTATPSVFGAPTPTTGPFGTAPQTQQTTFGGFGTGQATTGPFGSSTNTTSPFGTQSTNANTGGGFSSFSTVSAPSGFGTLTTTPNTNPFGSTNQSTSVFGAKPLGTGFGTSTSGTNAFNTAPNNSSIFGASNTMTMGGTGFGSASTPASTGLFGSTNTTPGGTFGQNTSSTSSVFGGQSMSIGTAFGSNPSTTPGSTGLFGNTSTTGPSTNVFGQSNPSTTVFGGFGATTSTTPGASTGMFGTVQTPQQSGTSSVPYQQTSKQDGNTTIMMQAITAMSQYEGKSFEELRYEDYMSGNRGTQGQQQAVSSFGGFGTSAQPNPSTSLFGTQPLGTSFSTSGSFVPSNAPTNSMFGAPTGSSAPTLSGGLFGSTQTTNAFTTSSSNQPTTTLFGAPAPTQTQSLAGGVFGSTQGTTTFPTSTTTSSLFGGTTKPLGSGFGSTTTNAFAPTSQTTSLFGAPATNTAPSFGGFGNALATSTASGAPAGGLFGTAASSTGSNLFGASTTPSSQGGSFFGATSANTAPTTGGLFGTPSSSTGGLFGTSTKPASSSLFGGNLFGTPSTNTGIGTGGFTSTLPVSTPTNASNSSFPSLSGGLFGTSFPLTGSSPGGLFGTATTTQPNTPSSGPFSSIPPTADTLLAQQLAAVEAQKKELALLDAWRGASPNSTRAVVAYAQPDRSASLRPSPSLLSDFRPSSSLIPFSSPPLSQSTVKVRPRGFARFESPSSRPNLDGVMSRNGSSPMLSPTAQLGLSTKNLIIKSKLTPKPMMKLNLGRDESPKIDTATQSEATGNDSIRRKNRMSLESIAGSSENGDSCKQTELQLLDDQNGGSDRHPFCSPYNGPVVNSQSVIESSVKKVEQRNDVSYDFYQNVISSPLPGGSSLLSPIVAVPETKKSLIPTLRKQSYTISPSLDILAKMSEGDLAAVSNFIVAREGYGSVAWEGAVDVRGIDLDSVVEIEAQAVAVYSLEEMKGTKPPIGSKLNRPAIITISNIYPPKGADASPDLKEKFIRKISSITKKNDAELISYDVETGVWRFRVFHFSRYGLMDDDGDDDDETDPLRAYHAQKENICAVHENTKAVTRFSIDDDFYDDDRARAIVDLVEPSLKDETLALQAADNAYKMLQLDSFQAERFLGTEKNQRKMVLQKFPDEGYQGMDLVRPVKTFQHLVPYCHHGISAKLGKQCGVLHGSSSKTDFGLRMGKSFRVGWRPDGSLVSPSFGNRKIFVSTFRPRFSEREEKEAPSTDIIKFLSTHLTHSECRPRQALFSLPKSSEGHFSVALKSILDSISHCKGGSQDVTILGVSLLLIIAQWQDVDMRRKRNALMSWFQQASSYEVLDKIDQRKHDDTIQRIYSSLCNNDICAAQSLANGNNYLQLSALITNSSVQASFDIKEQRNLWYTKGALNLVPPALSSLYSLRSGDLALEKDVMQYDKNMSSDSRLWRRCMGMLLFRNDTLDESSSDSLMRSLISTYKRALDKEIVPQPIAWYEESRRGQDKEFCFLYKLLLLLSKESVSLMEVISPQGYTQHYHDYLHSFILASAISSINGLPCATAEEGLWICDSVATQLINIGHWEWAVYVYLYQFSPEMLSLSKRKERAKDIVIRFMERSAVSKRFFLRHDLGVPDVWLEESLAYRAKYHEGTTATY